MRISGWSSDVCSSDLTRLHNFQPLNLGTALITVHKDSSQHHASPWQGGLPQVLIPRWTGRSCILRANAPALAAIVRDGERDASTRSAFNAALAAALEDRKSTRLHSSPECADRMPT